MTVRSHLEKPRDGSSRVAICVTTYRRPAGLERLLTALLALSWHRMTPPELTTIVVENDVSEIARALCAEPRWEALNIRYASQPRPGIEFARNTCLDLAKQSDAEWIAFIDDDEIPAPVWLEELLIEQERSDASVVAGPVLPRFSVPPPEWITHGRFHLIRPDFVVSSWRQNRDAASLRRDPPPGTPLRVAATSNVLFRRTIATNNGLRFQTLEHAGYGEDSLFFLQLAKLGHRMTWAPAALAYHQISQDRVSLRWLMRSSYQKGIAQALIAARLNDRWARLRNSILHLSSDALTLVMLPFRARHKSAATLISAASSIGCIAGTLSIRATFDRRLPPLKPHPSVPVYIIALQGSPRVATLITELERQLVPFTRIDAVDGMTLTPEWIEEHHDAALAASRLGRPMGRREIGCALSHRAVYESIVQRGEQSAIVLEEDAILAPDFHHFWRAADQISEIDGIVSLHADRGYVRSKPELNMGDFTVHRALTTLYSNVGYLISNRTAKSLHDATGIISTVADWPLDGAALNHHVILPMPVSHSFDGSLLEDERTPSRTDAPSFWERGIVGIFMRVTLMNYFRQRRRYLSITHFVRTEIRPILYRHLGIRANWMPAPPRAVRSGAKVHVAARGLRENEI